jgi:NitT/TauT family transport system substrate-binding protein
MLKKVLTMAAVIPLALAGSAQAQEVVRLGNLKFAHYGAVSYIKEIAPKCGLKVEERVFSKGLDAMQAVIAGELDVGAVSSEAAISGRASGTPIYVVAGLPKGARLVARADLSVKTVKDLKGKKVGVTRGGIQDILLAAELSQNGLTYSDQPGKDVQIIYLGFPDLNQALLGKNIDAMMQSEPYSSQSIGKGFGKEVIKPYDTPLGEPVRAMVMTEKFYKERRPVAEKFMRCFVEATKAFIDNKDLAEKYVRESMFKGQVSHEDFVNAIGNSPYSYDMSVEHIQVTTDLMQKYGIGKMSKPPVAKEWVKTDLLSKRRKV